MSDDFETVGKFIGAKLEDVNGVPYHPLGFTEAAQAFDRIEARLSTAEEALTAIMDTPRSLPVPEYIKVIARNALRSDHQKEPTG